MQEVDSGFVKKGVNLKTKAKTNFHYFEIVNSKNFF